MALRPCAWCDHDYQPHNPKQQHCSPRCAQLHRQHTRRQQPDYTPPTSTWRTYTANTTDRGLGGDHQRLKRQLLPAAIGTICPYHHTDPRCTGIMRATDRLALDHIKARRLGGLTVRANVRITHYDCNHRAGTRLGHQLLKARQRQRSNAQIAKGKTDIA